MNYIMFGFKNILDLVSEIVDKYINVEFYEYDCYPTEFECTLLGEKTFDEFEEDIENILNDLDQKLTFEYNLSHEMWDDVSDPDYNYGECKITITRLDFME